MNPAEELVSECCLLLAPPPRQTLSEWAEENFVLSPEYSAATGRLQLYAFQRGILDSFTDPYVTETVVMSATQLIKTLFLQCCIAYAIARDPGPILLAQPTETDAETFSKERIAPMIRDMVCLRTRVAPEKRTSKANTTLHKVYAGGSLTLIGAQTAGNFARRSIRYFFADERDKWPKNVGKEGDGYSLGVKRQATFRSRAKRVQTCSPTIEGDSQIAAAYEGSDQRKFWVPCPACGTHQVLRWEQVVWEADEPRSARYKCAHCEALWGDVQRWEACERGEWRAGKPFAGIAGFWISELYSPWKRLGDLAADFLAKKDDPAQLQTFVNTSLAETWKGQGEAPPDYEVLMGRHEDYEVGKVPLGPLFLTAGFDVQGSWLEGYVWGWGRGCQRWCIDHIRVERGPSDPEAWVEMDRILNRTWKHPSGAELTLVRLAIDTGYQGAYGQPVYAWSRRHGASRVLAVDGRATGLPTPPPSMVDVTVRGKKISNGCKLFGTNVSHWKSELYGKLNLPRPEVVPPYPDGWVHFPINLPVDFYRQLTSEEFRLEVGKNGIRKMRWVPIENRRHEALDCANYARFAAAHVGMDRHASDDRWWRTLEGQLEAVHDSAVEHQPEVQKDQAAIPAPVQQPRPAQYPQPRRRTMARFSLI